MSQQSTVLNSTTEDQVLFNIIVASVFLWPAAHFLQNRLWGNQWIQTWDKGTVVTEEGYKHDTWQSTDALELYTGQRLSPEAPPDAHPSMLSSLILSFIHLHT